MKDFRQIKAIEAANKKRILKVNPNVPDRSGIYFLLREECGFKYAYIGQAKRLLTRLAQHLSGYQHIDLSIKKHGLYDDFSNRTGYTVNYIEFDEAELDEKEQYYIQKYGAAGYQLRNETSGSQGKGKKALDGSQPKGYQKGVEYGYTKARKEVAHLFDLHLTFDTKKHPATVNQQKAAQKFADFLDFENKR